MSSKVVDAKMLQQLFLAGAKGLESKKEWINDLNVFPVPDGDTGTNMTMTIMAAAKEVASLEELSMNTLCKAISSGSLRGARGNSGVILSQLLRGFCKEVKDYEEITVLIASQAFERAVETAYKAVMKPKEGTILTVAKGMSDKAVSLAMDGVEDFETFLEAVIATGDEVLSKTPDMLPVLKQAGVVDSGGQGLMVVLHTAYDLFLGKEIDLTISEVSSTPGGPRLSSQAAQPEAEIKFGYCTEFIILLNRQWNAKIEKDYKAFLESIGDSIVVVADEDVVKTHVHTNDPGLAIQRALTYGQLNHIKIDNMRIEHHEKVVKMAENDVKGQFIPLSEENKEKQISETKQPLTDEPRKADGFVAVAVGDGIAEIFRGLGIDYIIEGGQTMNPSTEDMLNAIGQVNADTVYIFPNNKNIILAANQAQSLVEDKKIVVVPTKTIPQGITALINYVADLSAEENLETMVSEMKKVKTGQVTYAVRDTVIDDKEIRENDFMGIGDKGILSVNADMMTATKEMIEAMIDEDTELISVYYGIDVNEQEAASLSEYLSTRYPSCDVELQNGGQPIYYFMISAE